MSHPSSKHICEIYLATPVDGRLIEDFIAANHLRSGEIQIYGAENEDVFSTSSYYRAILVGSSSPDSGRDSARQLAREFDGFLV